MAFKMRVASAILGKRLIHRLETPRTIYLTFDDGPHERHTNEVLDVLGDFGVRGTFFMVGRDVSRNRSIAQRVASLGHRLGNHTLTHPRMDRLSTTSRRLEITAMDHLLGELQAPAAGFAFRPPYGYVSPRMLAQCIHMRRTIAMWSRDSFDFRAGVDEVVRGLETQPVREGDIVLFHDDSAVAAPALRRLIPQWMASGYAFGVLAA